ncbi:MAG TPA: SRPBCC domain-containing protein [Variovorax sp.]
MQPTQQQEPARLSLSRAYPVPPEKVWRAWTEAQALSRWFGPGEGSALATAEIDLRVGGCWRIAFGTPDGASHEVSGVYQEVVPQRRLVFTWAWKSTPERVSRVSIDLKPTAAGTELDFVHDRFFDEQARANHARGWLPLLDKLDHFLQSAPQEA